MKEADVHAVKLFDDWLSNRRSPIRVMVAVVTVGRETGIVAQVGGRTLALQAKEWQPGKTATKALMELMDGESEVTVEGVDA